MDINNITPEVAKEINNLVFKTMQELKAKIDKASIDGTIKRNFYDRLNESDLWDCTSIAEEYTKIKDKTSTLPRTLRDAVSTIFEAGIAKYIANHKDDNKDEVQ